MKKFKFLFIQGVQKRTKTKAFLISNIVMAVIIIALTLIPSIVTAFSSNDEPIIEHQVVEGDVYYLNKTDDTRLMDILIDHAKVEAGQANATWKAVVKEYNGDPNTYYSNIENKGSILIVLNKVNQKLIVDYYSYFEDTVLDVLIKNSILELNRLIYLENNPSVDISEIGNTTVTVVPNEEKIANEMREAMNTGISSILIIPLFMLVVMGIQFIGTDIIEEKSSKAIEVIIASVPPRTHFFAKITSTVSFLGLQLILYLVYGLIGTLINSLFSKQSPVDSWGMILGDQSSLLFQTILIALSIALIGTLLYLVIAAFLASVAVNQEDFQQVQSPMMIVLMLGYFASIFANASNSVVLIKVLAYIPFTSPMVAAGAFFSGHIQGWEVIIITFILLLTVFLTAMVLAPIYKASILSYDEGKLFKRIKKIIKSSNTKKRIKK